MTDATMLLSSGSIEVPEATAAVEPRALKVLRRFTTGLFLVVAVVLAAIVVGPRFLPYEALIVRSGSMSPTIPTGSVVFYHREAASSVKVGQVIAFVRPGNDPIVVTHRVHEIVDSASGRYFVTKGDANAMPDDWRVPAEGSGWVAFFHLPDIGYAFSLLSSLWARLALITVPALGLGLILLLEQREGHKGGQGAPAP